MIFAEIFIWLGSSIDNAVAPFIPGYALEVTTLGKTQSSALGVGVAIGALAALGLFTWWFRKEFRGVLGLNGLKKGLLMLAPFLVFHYAGSVASWAQFGTSSVLIAFLRAFAPGFGEEITFRGMGVANYMRTIKSEKQITVIFWLSAVVFGIAHIFNSLTGAPIWISLLQCAYCIGIGLLLAAVYLRTGTLWPLILAHWSVDFMEFIRGDLGSTGGLMMNMGIGDWITIAAGFFAGGLGLYLMNKKNYPAIMELWRHKWDKALDTE
jgi:membrane protease YdiL (CAAX protease family)